MPRQGLRRRACRPSSSQSGRSAAGMGRGDAAIVRLHHCLDERIDQDQSVFGARIRLDVPAAFPRSTESAAVTALQPISRRVLLGVLILPLWPPG